MNIRITYNLQKDKKKDKDQWKVKGKITYPDHTVKDFTKRGFATKREAEEWAREFAAKYKTGSDIPFSVLVDRYFEALSPRLRENTLRTKHYIIDLKIMPYFRDMRVTEITADDVMKWENNLIASGYADTYKKCVYNQLNAIFNYAVRFQKLQVNPCREAGAIGKNKADEMQFWTKKEFAKFIEAVKDKPMSYCAFNVLFWTGLRIGEMLALTPADIDLDDRTITVNKSYQRLGKKDVITPPKTKKGNRIISIPEFLCEIIRGYKNALYGIGNDDRLFPCTKYFLHHEMKRGCKKSGVKRIRLHDIRHSHCALLYEMGIPPLEIAQRLGHERVETTMNVYAHLYPNKQQALSAKLDALMNPPSEGKGGDQDS